MKNKFTFSKEGIKDFFFRHVEKLFFGLACALILFFMWFGFKTPAFKATTPEDMLSKTRQAETFINDSSHWNKLEAHRIADKDAADRIKNAKPVNPETYVYRQLMGSAVATRAPRRDPAFVPVNDFNVKFFRSQVARVVAGESGGLALAGSMKGLPDSDLVMPADQRNESFMYRGDSLPDGARLLTRDVIVGMALINHELQLKNYTENFQYQKEYDADRDVPEYAFIEVQRKTATTEWKSITAHVYENTAKLGAKPAKELADERYISDNITRPIPAFLGKDYRDISLIDSIPMRDVFEETDERKKKQSRDQRDKKESKDNSGSDDDVFGNNNKKKPKAEVVEEDKEEVIPTRLVRFYDLENKEIGETYFYRLRVWLKDPNNPDAVNADIAAAGKSDGRGGVGIGGGTGGGGSMADGPGGGSGKNSKKPKVKKPLSEYSLAGDVRARVFAADKEVPADIVISDEGLRDDQKELARGPLFKLAVPTEWVEATQSVTVTSGFETFVGGPVASPPIVRTNGGSFALSEPEVTVVANSFQDDLEVFVPAQTKALRGSLLNFNAVTNLLDPLTWTIKEVYASKDEKKGTKKGRRFMTNAIILDIMGGERTGPGADPFKTPGECLIMDRNNNIHFHNELDDATAYRHANFVSPGNTQTREAASGKKKKDDDADNDMGGGRDRGRGR